MCLHRSEEYFLYPAIPKTVTLKGWVIVACFIALGGCGGLPTNFENLSLEEQVAAYEEHLNSSGHPKLFAQSHISWHGWAAADLMAQYLAREKSGLPEYEVIQIIDLVQLRGCSLRGTPAEHALERFLADGNPDLLERQAAESALDSIRRNVVVPGSPDALKGGPCRPN